MAHLNTGQCAAEEKKSDATSRERKLQTAFEKALSIGCDSEFFRSRNEVLPPRSTTCHSCGLSGSRRCSRCHQTYYCSVECQKQDWKAHSVICRAAESNEGNCIKTPSGEDIMNGGQIKTPTPDPKIEVVNGRKVMLCEIQEDVLREGTEFQGFAVEFSSPSNFFVKALNAKSVDNLMKVTSLLQSFYSNPDNLRKAYTPEIGEVCVAKYKEDQQWYRALVYNVEVTMKTAQVLYLDYGNTEIVSLDSVQPMHEAIELFPPCALHCAFAHVTVPPYGWTPECLVEVKSLLTGQKLLIRIVDVVQGELPQYMVEVSLLDSGKNVNNIIIEKGYSFPPLNKGQGKVEDPETVPRPAKESEMPDLMPGDVHQSNAAPKLEVMSSSLRVGDRFETLLTFIQNPGVFFCQLVKNAKDLAEVTVRMHELYHSTSPTSPGFLPAPGEICAAQFTEDNNWYRASAVRQVSGDSVLIGYLDFGNAEILPISRVRRLEPTLLSIPFQAAQCCLAGVKPRSGEWTSEATDIFKDLVMNKILTASLVADCDRVLTLELVDESVTTKISIAQHLIDAGLAVPITVDGKTSAEEEAGHPKDSAEQLRWTELPLGQETEVLVCFLQSPEDFYCHIHNQTVLQLLNKLNVALGQYCMEHKSEGYYPAREEICGAYYTGDGNWYRAQVKDHVTAGSAKIRFLDYGNTEEVSVDKLCKLPSGFLELPFQAISCSLSGVKPIGENWSEDSMRTFQKSVVGVKLLATAIVRTKQGYSVELKAIESGAVIADQLMATKCAVREDTTVKEKMDVNNNKALRPPRDLLLTSKVLPVWNADTGAATHKELNPRDCNSSPSRPLSPVQSIPSILKDACFAIPKTSKVRPSSHTAPRHLISDPPADGRELPSHNSDPVPVTMRFPKSIPSNVSKDFVPSTHRAPHLNNTLYPKESHGPTASSLFHKEACATNPKPLVPSRGPGSKSVPKEFSSCGAPAPDRKELHPSIVSPSLRKMHQIESIPAASRESSVTNSASLVPSLSRKPIPGESNSCVSPAVICHVTSTVDLCKPNSNHSTPSTPREFQFSKSPLTAVSKSSPSEERQVTPNSYPTNEAFHGKIQNFTEKSVSGHCAASCQRPSGVSVAQTWISVDLPLNEAIPACFLKVISSDLFYVFPKENRVDVKRLGQVMKEIFEYCSKEANPHDYSPAVGDACCAKFTEDGQWYRAVILELQDSSARIVYADYGNVEILPLSCLHPIKESFLELPLQLTKCSLSDLLPVIEPWPPEATCTLNSLLFGAEVLITIKSLDAGIYHVAMDKQQGNGVLHVVRMQAVDGRAVSVTPRTKGCSEGSYCACYRDLLNRMEKLEQVILHLMEKLN